MGDEQQYDETQTGDAKIRDLGREYFPLRLVVKVVCSARSCTLPGVCNVRFRAGVGFVVKCTGHQGGSWQAKVLRYYLGYIC